MLVKQYRGMKQLLSIIINYGDTNCAYMGVLRLSTSVYFLR